MFCLLSVNVVPLIWKVSHYCRYEILFKQNITAEDIFLGMSTRNPSTACCEGLTVSVPTVVRFICQSRSQKLNHLPPAGPLFLLSLVSLIKKR